MLLSRKGHTVTHAVNGAEALERILAGYEERSGGDEEVSIPGSAACGQLSA
jgi:predicted nucleotidyltransferase